MPLAVGSFIFMGSIQAYGGPVRLRPSFINGGTGLIRSGYCQMTRSLYMLRTLCDVLRRAVNQFLGDVERDRNLKNNVQKNSAELLCYKPSQTIDLFIAA